jgi:hypothetical protein
MGESMAGEQSEEPRDGTPKIFKSMTGWIGGATAVVVALGGLYTAYDKFIVKVKPSAELAANVEDQSTDTDASASQSAGTAAPEQPERESYTTGDGGTLAWDEGMWLWTDKDGTEYRYKEEANDGTTIVARIPNGGEKGEDVWLRWPNAGGKALQSFDDRERWTETVKVTPQDPNAPSDS